MQKRKKERILYFTENVNLIAFLVQLELSLKIYWIPDPYQRIINWLQRRRKSEELVLQNI